MIISCWNRLYRGTLLRLVFSRLCPLSGVGDLVGIVDHISGNSAHVAVLAGNSGFLGNRSQTHCAWVRGWVVGLVWPGTNVDFRELVSNGKLLGEDDPCQPHG